MPDRQREKCCCTCGWAGFNYWMCMNEGAQKRSPAEGLQKAWCFSSSLREWIHASVNIIILDYIESAAVPWHYHQLADC